PELASTLAFIMRLIPATPTADNKAPIVVGIRHTNKAIRAVIETGEPWPVSTVAKLEKGNKVTQTSRKISVRATSKIFKAISLGVPPRLAPSTIAIMRSRKASPGLAVTCLTIQSDRTRVPPVTEQKSP